MAWWPGKPSKKADEKFNRLSKAPELRDYQRVCAASELEAGDVYWHLSHGAYRPAHVIGIDSSEPPYVRVVVKGRHADEPHTFIWGFNQEVVRSRRDSER